MTAVFSPCRKYRYRLEREVGDEGRVASIIMVNGSYAGESDNDHTVTKWIGFSKRLQIRRFVIGNLFGFAATDIKELRGVRDPIGPDNDMHLENILRDGDLHIVAWGTMNKLPEALRGRWKDVVRLADRCGVKTLYCFGTAQDGHPLHPLMLSYDSQLVEWKAPWFANRQVAA